MEQICFHLPVMPVEVEQYLVTRKNGCYVDCTLGGGGHSYNLLSKYPKLRVIGLDQDQDAVERSSERLSQFGGRIKIFRENFKNLKNLLAGVGRVDGVLADLGISSKQIDDKNRGFSFHSPNLDMRMDGRDPVKAEDIINDYNKQELADIFYKYGEERKSRQLAEIIVRERERNKIISGEHLAAILSKTGRAGKIHPATRVFMALRIFVNNELKNLETLLNDLPGLLKPSGRVVFLSYHSLEDRIIKQNFRQMQSENIYKIINKKVIIPSENEIAENPRSRSAKLRAVEKV